MQVLSCTIKSLIFKINKDLFLTVWHLRPTLTVPKIFRDTTRNISRNISFSSTFHVKVYIAEMSITFLDSVHLYSWAEKESHELCVQNTFAKNFWKN